MCVCMLSVCAHMCTACGHAVCMYVLCVCSVCVYVYVHVYVCVCICTYVCACVCVYSYQVEIIKVCNCTLFGNKNFDSIQYIITPEVWSCINRTFSI